MANLHCECQELKPKGETNSSFLVLHPSSGVRTVKTVGSHLKGVKLTRNNLIPNFRKKNWMLGIIVRNERFSFKRFNSGALSMRNHPDKWQTNVGFITILRWLFDLINIVLLRNPITQMIFFNQAMFFCYQIFLILFTSPTILSIQENCMRNEIQASISCNRCHGVLILTPQELEQ